MKEPGLKIALQNILKMFVILICHFTVCINLEENLDQIETILYTYSGYLQRRNISKLISKNFQKLGHISESIWNYFQMFGKMSNLLRNSKTRKNFQIYSKKILKIFQSYQQFFLRVRKISKYFQFFFQMACKHYVIIQIKSAISYL